MLNQLNNELLTKFRNTIDRILEEKQSDDDRILNAYDDHVINDDMTSGSDEATFIARYLSMNISIGRSRTDKNLISYPYDITLGGIYVHAPINQRELWSLLCFIIRFLEKHEGPIWH